MDSSLICANFPDSLVWFFLVGTVEISLTSDREILKEALLNGSVFILLGSLIVEIIAKSDRERNKLEVVTGEIFYLATIARIQI